MIDLHTHSTASDGSFSPSALMQLAKAKGLHAIALTDHDTIDGIEEAAYEANKLGIQFIPGTEIEIDWEEPNSEESFDENSEATGKKREFHLLGLGIHSPSANFLLMLQDLKEKRERRNLSIIEKMRDLGMDADYNEIAVIAGTDCIEQGIIGRPHFAKYLVHQKKAKNIQQAFDKYLGKGKVLYMQKENVPLKTALACIKESGGRTVLAHPSTLYVSWGRLPSILTVLKSQGLEGLEAYHPLLTKNSAERMEILGKSLGLFITAGSDFHGAGRADRKLGHTSGGIKIKDDFDALLYKFCQNQH